MTEAAFVEHIRSTGARVFRVGGCVRDRFRGVPAKDVDYVLTGMTEETLCAIFPGAEKIGKSFPVYHVRVDGVRREVAFARRERKTGAGYRGFAVAFDPSVTIAEDLYRRDTTMNAMALELPAEKLFDPYGGRDDLAAGVIRAVSEHFMEDPVRALRAARQAAEFGFAVEEGTLHYMNACAAELKNEPTERLMGELRRALAAPRPSVFFRVLRAADLLAVTFPEIAALEGQTQPTEFHPEGDALAHTLAMVDAVACETEELKTRFAALVHDLGKGLTPREMLPHHYGHERTGLDALAAWNRRMTLPHDWRKAAAFVIHEHMRAPRLTRPGKIADLLLGIGGSGLSIAEFNVIIRADHGSLPDYLARGSEYLAAMRTVTGRSAPPELSGAEVGRWLREQRVRILKNSLLEM